MRIAAAAGSYTSNVANRVTIPASLKVAGGQYRLIGAKPQKDIVFSVGRGSYIRRGYALRNSIGKRKRKI